MTARLGETERYWSKVSKTDSCWLWIGGCFVHGYGRFVVKGHEWYAHGYMLAELHGVELPLGHHVHHVCEVKNCVNPAHLQVLTPKEHHAVTPNRRIEGKRAQTHCESGHPFDEENTLIRRNGTRNCRRCARLRCDVYKARKHDQVLDLALAA